jgi:hypothetical protein
MFIETTFQRTPAPEERNVCLVKIHFAPLERKRSLCSGLSYKHLATLWPGVLIDVSVPPQVWS